MTKPIQNDISFVYSSTYMIGLPKKDHNCTKIKLFCAPSSMGDTIPKQLLFLVSIGPYLARERNLKRFDHGIMKNEPVLVSDPVISTYFLVCRHKGMGN